MGVAGTLLCLFERKRTGRESRAAVCCGSIDRARYPWCRYHRLNVWRLSSLLLYLTLPASVVDDGGKKERFLAVWPPVAGCRYSTHSLPSVLSCTWTAA